ncbi:MAG: hypothetical protein J6P55_10840 [Bacteroidaceae bacterium]|nr:hypothetical protein [Bacteroidaceae bacterium]
MFQSFGLTSGTIEETTHMHVFGDPSYHFPTGLPHDLDSINVYRCNDSIYIELNEISPCTIIFIKENNTGSILAYKRIEELTSDYHFSDSIEYNRIVIKKDNSIPVVLRQMKRAYLQNINVNSEKEVGGGIVMTGKSVTNKISKGEVAVREGGSLRLNYTEKAVLDKGFKVKLGGKLTISKRE